ncbi:hypothetical protein ECZU06_22540 [Escherichia coli]|nr:hypothetical protein ECZU06_22540 [Escherichia coli]
MLDQNNIMPTGLQFGSGVRIVGTQKTFTEGNVETTDNAMNVAIMGQGFLQVQRPTAISPIPATATCR